MPKYRVKITKAAEDDIVSVFEHIAQNNQAVAIKWVEEVERQIDSLGKFPQRCPIIPETEELGQEYHQLIYGNYRTIFCIQGLVVIIMRVVHHARLLDMQLFEK